VNHPFGQKKNTESFFFFIYWAGQEQNLLLLRPLIGLLYQPWIMDGGDDCAAVGRMNDWQGKLKYLAKPAPVLRCLSQIPHDLTRAHTWAAVVGSRRLIASVVARQNVES
jgi:hypothetical protein